MWGGGGDVPPAPGSSLNEWRFADVQSLRRHQADARLETPLALLRARLVQHHHTRGYTEANVGAIVAEIEALDCSVEVVLAQQVI